jgi:hypothetical protein
MLHVRRIPSKVVRRAHFYALRVSKSLSSKIVVIGSDHDVEKASLIRAQARNTSIEVTRSTTSSLSRAWRRALGGGSLANLSTRRLGSRICSQAVVPEGLPCGN